MVELEPIVVNEKKDLLVKEFNKAEVGEIVKDYLKQHPGVLDEALASRSIEEIVKSAVTISDEVMSWSSEPVTPEIDAFLKKCVSIGRIYLETGGMVLFLNYVDVTENKEIFGACFGCMTTNENNGHSGTGAHLEFAVLGNDDEKTVSTYFSEA